jgi:hypothetical protein
MAQFPMHVDLRKILRPQLSRKQKAPVITSEGYAYLVARGEIDLGMTDV